MSIISDDSSSYYSEQNSSICEICSKALVNTESIHLKNANRKKSYRSRRLFTSIIKHVFMPCLFTKARPNNINFSKSYWEYCSCNSPCKVSESNTVFEKEHPWIVPSDYHKDIVSSSVPKDDPNQWIYRTGWTPQPDSLALLDRGWCKNCGSCVKSDSVRCSACHVEPLITTRHNLITTGIDEEQKQ